MATKRGNPDQYLQHVGNTWYARVRVPRTLEKVVGQSHVRRSLKTSSRAEANQLKHRVVADLKGELAALRATPPKERGPAGYTLADARALREQLQALRESPQVTDEDHASTLEDVASNMAETVEALHGEQRAAKWLRAATASDESLVELLDTWLAGSDNKKSTQAGHRKAVGDLLVFLEDDEARPEDVTRKTASRFVDALTGEGKLAHSTISDRLVSLAGFWAWMDSKALLKPAPNPWKGHRVSKSQNPGTRPPKRKGGYAPDELLKLLQGNDRARGWPTWSYLPDLMVLGMFTGSRIEKLCDLTPEKVEAVRGGYLLHIEGDKTDAGSRLVGVVHPAPVAVLKRRLQEVKAGALLFRELAEQVGGYDARRSASASKAYGRYRKACGVPDGTDFHSFRRNVIDTLLRATTVRPVEVSRFVGHKVGNLAADTYAGQSLTQAETLAVARKVRYAAEVEAAALVLSQHNEQQHDEDTPGAIS